MSSAGQRSLPIPALERDDAKPLVDLRARPLRDLRISVTDRCNFRCTYCMPKEIFGREYAFLARPELLTFEEIVRLAKIFGSFGVEKIRLTGGEPLVRNGIETLVDMLSRALPDTVLALTTNGSQLKTKAARLKAAGLHRITVSLDSLDDATFKAMTDVDVPVASVLEGIDAAARAGLVPLKVNTVVKRGLNDAQIVEIARHFKGTGHIVRFIEFMDVGTTNGWNMDQVVPSAEVVRAIDAVFPCEPADPNYTGEVAKRWRYKDGAGEFGVISSVTEAFCNSCTRARLSSDGLLYTCLFAGSGYDLKSLLRGGKTDAEIGNAIAAIWYHRDDRYSELRTSATTTSGKVEMSFIGG